MLRRLEIYLNVTRWFSWFNCTIYHRMQFLR